MKQLANLLAMAGIVLVVTTLYGRFHGSAGIVGFSGSGLLTSANTLLLLSLVVSSLKK